MQAKDRSGKKENSISDGEWHIHKAQRGEYSASGVQRLDRIESN